MTKNIVKYFLMTFLVLNICSCLSVPLSNQNKWEEVERITLEYDMDFLEKNLMLLTTDKDRDKAFNIFKEYWNNAMLVKIASEVNLNKNNTEHELIVSRRWVELDYVSFYIYQFQINYINYIIKYEFITDNRRGASNYGSDNRFFNLYKQEKEKFYIDIKSEMKIIANKLSKSENPIALSQALAIIIALEVEDSMFFFL